MISDSTYKFFADLIFEISGMNYQENDYYRLESRINALMTQFSCDTEDQLINLFKNNFDAEMKKELINISTNNETFFFRDKKPFQYLSNSFIPSLIEKAQDGLMIWSAASSTGQEALSILMTIKKNHPKFFDGVEIDASDISHQALNKAKVGNYSNLEVQRGLPIKLLMDNFDNQPDNSWTVKDELLNKIHFFEFNLLSGKFKTDFYDVIFCRNILIYQNKENKEAILSNLHKSLKPGGILVLGAGESLIGFQTDFVQEHEEGLMLYKKN